MRLLIIVMAAASMACPAMRYLIEQESMMLFTGAHHRYADTSIDEKNACTSPVLLGVVDVVDAALTLPIARIALAQAR